MITEKNVIQANKLLKKLFPNETEFHFSQDSEDDYQELVSDSMSLQILYGMLYGEANKPNSKHEGYLVQGIVHYDGNYENPPDWDVVDLKEFKDFNGALNYLFEEEFRNRVSCIWQDIAEEEIEIQKNALETD